MKIDLSRFRDTFFEEAYEHVARIEQELLALEGADDARDRLDAIFRAAHSIKGASGAFGLTGVTQFTHALESVLDRLRDGAMPCDRGIIDLLLAANDVLKDLLDAARHGGDDPPAMPHVLGRLNALLTMREVVSDATLAGTGPAAAGAVPTAPGADARRAMCIRFRPSADIMRQGLDPQVLLLELAELGDVVSTTVDCASLPVGPLAPGAAAFDPESCYLAWTIVLHTDATPGVLRDVFLFAEDGAEIDIAELTPAAASGLGIGAPEAARAGVSQALSLDARTQADDRRAGPDRRRATETVSLRVSTDKVDRLIDLVGEIVIAQSMVSNLAEDLSLARLAQLRDAVQLLERNTRELQERVMAIRMVPVGGVFSRFPRLVRDIASSLGKEVRVEMHGEETEIDKGVVERIGDPLTHLIRNAVDHGLESPDVRLQAGKPAEGVIRLDAYARGGLVIIEVADDGRGLDSERIRAKAIAQGLITADQVLSPEALHQLIFHPGFSTAQTVSDLSGRGVGMDVVKRNVEELNGTVTLESRPGAGTRVKIGLPLTLAILDGQSLVVGDTVYVLPLTAIVESLRPKPSEVCTVLGEGEVVRVRGDAVPLVRLHHYLGVHGSRLDPTQGIVVLVEHQGRRVALLADELRGQHQVVIKSLDTHYRRVDGVMGATIMGDGSVALILDIPSLLRRVGPGGGRSEAAPAA
jgi:two-component system chemotaxis sensor kinase CheA